MSRFANVFASRRRPPLLVFADDWGRHPSSCQHLIHRMLDRFPVWWVNTIGTRPPRFDLATLRRGWEKARHWLSRDREGAVRPTNLHVVNPRMWPWFSKPHDRWLNRVLLGKQLQSLIETFSEPPVAITTLPIVADLVGRLPVARWIYYCVDDFAAWPGLDGDAMRQMERILVSAADSVIAVSEQLQAKLAGMGRAAPLLTHGVDSSFWRGPGREVPQLSNLPRPLIVFWGVIDRRMDIALVRRLANDLAEGTILLVGPLDSPDPELFHSRRVVHLPPVPYDCLPWLARQAQALIMPYGDLPVTQAMQPLKLKEYLVGDRPVVVRELPSTRCWADCLDLVHSPEAFSWLVRRRLTEGLPASQRIARGRLVEESWENKVHAFERWLFPEAALPSRLSAPGMALSATAGTAEP